jgi:hypothetical protein
MEPLVGMPSVRWKFHHRGTCYGIRLLARTCHSWREGLSSKDREDHDHDEIQDRHFRICDGVVGA